MKKHDHILLIFVLFALVAGFYFARNDISYTGNFVVTSCVDSDNGGPYGGQNVKGYILVDGKTRYDDRCTRTGTTFNKKHFLIEYYCHTVSGRTEWNYRQIPVDLLNSRCEDSKIIRVVDSNRCFDSDTKSSDYNKDMVINPSISKNPLVKGTVRKSYTPSYTFTDYCIGQDLVEYYCEETPSRWEMISGKWVYKNADFGVKNITFKANSTHSCENGLMVSKYTSCKVVEVPTGLKYSSVCVNEFKNCRKAFSTQKEVIYSNSSVNGNVLINEIINNEFNCYDTSYTMLEQQINSSDINNLIYLSESKQFALCCKVI